MPFKTIVFSLIILSLSASAHACPSGMETICEQVARTGTSSPLVSPWTKEPTYKKQMVAKLRFGLKNTLFGWTEIFTELVEHLRDHRSPLATGQGIGNVVMDEIGGALHLLTFPLVKVDVPLPEDGVDFHI